MQEILHSVGPLMAVGALGFYVLSALTILGLIWAVDRDRSGWATSLLVVYLILLALSGSFNVFTWALHHPLILFAYVVGYLVTGAVWTWFQWEFFTSEIQMQYDELRANFLKGKGLTDLLSQAEKDSFKDYAKRQGFGPEAIPVRVSRNKSRLYLWCAYWPFSIIWSGLHRPVKFLVRWVVNTMGGFLQARSNAKFAKYSELN